MDVISPAGLPDATLAFRRDPYRFISQHCDETGGDAVRTRLMLAPTVCMRGPEAARLLYDEDLVTRDGAVPPRVAGVLFGKGGVQQLDGAPHRARKAMLLSLMTPDNMSALVEKATASLLTDAEDWQRQESVEMLPALERSLTRATLDWCGVPLDDSDLDRTSADLTRLFSGAASVGPRYWHTARTRRRCDRWAARLVSDHRSGRRTAPPGTALAVIADWRDPQGAELPKEVAAVELLNIIRPTVAVAVWWLFLLHALTVEGGRPADEAERRRYALEVRRLYPFFPVIGGVARRDTRALGGEVRAGDRLLLEVQGTNRHRSAWAEADRFDPSRFDGRDPGPFDFVAQGGGDFGTGHRCAGEWIAERLMIAFLEIFTERLAWRGPDPPPELDTSRLPALPKGGLRLGDIRLH
ncbi:cytochrome P450 [Histidinibacterium aquaticum]|uniref:Cytochrome P450 n=1 Tax=Histidinibacterium aquaticum TaxID=2613962 RepID=A0A5J5GMS5_9RHOB|nr:cytochrome P450 [Histidinibacterium aquaticum]KAA9008993.1 cytochrome P450 [Histidinibacterium aquaticum]